MTTYQAAEGVFCSQMAFQTSRHLQRRSKQVTAQRTTRQRGWSHLLRESLLPRDCTRNRQLSRMTFKKSDHTRSSPCWWRSWLVLPAVVRNCAARRIAERDVRPSRVAVAHGTLPPHAVCVDGGLHMHESPPLETTATHLITRRPLTSHSGGALTSASCCCFCHAKKTSSVDACGRMNRSFPNFKFVQKGSMRMSESSFPFFFHPGKHTSPFSSCVLCMFHSMSAGCVLFKKQ